MIEDGPKPTLKLKLTIAGILIGLFAVAFYFAGGFDYIPRLRASATSNDGALRVEVYEKRLALRPIFARMGAIAYVYDRDDKLLYEKVIYADDDWDDTLGVCCKQIEFVDDRILIGPNPYRNEPYVIKFADLAAPSPD